MFSGNPAAVVPLDDWLPDEIMQAIAQENNLSETAFYVEKNKHFHIRWFTPVIEVDLCGHATLATAHCLYQHRGFREEQILFQSRKGQLRVKQADRGYLMDFPADSYVKVSDPEGLIGKGLFQNITDSYLGTDDYMVVLPNQQSIESLKPDFGILDKIGARGVLVTAPGREVDFVSRAFFPKFGINEDPVTGSAHTLLTPYWAARLGKRTLTAKQLSARGGDLICTLVGDRVKISGQARTYLQGEITI
ncbi:MAG: PhzF family phenazine biosynthesis protein [Saprospiraceae bacterium]|nr:PhzF family phenazine biosynthesis protein [Saprospiraceae bacterium]